MPIVKISFLLNDVSASEMIIADLSDLRYYAFEENDNQLHSFIEIDDFNEREVTEIASKYNCTFEKLEIEEQNWNKEWEANFQPVLINDTTIIRADFHDKPDQIDIDIIITPKMSFGTGHHATTFLMVKAMEQIELAGKTVLDFGTGTGVLAIYAEMKGSLSVMAIDNDQWSIENAKENVERNNCKAVKILKADRPPSDEKFDLVLANINTHILLKNVEAIRSVCKKDGHLLISGFIRRDVKTLTDSFKVGGFHLVSTDEKDGWYCLLLKN